MKRRIIEIDESLCNGCGLCVNACHEGAIGLVEGKAKLLRDDYCDGLGNCLPVCPTGAINFVEREAKEFDEEAVKAHMAAAPKHAAQAGGCPGMRMSVNERAAEAPIEGASQPSVLRQWPVQIRLVPANAQFLNGADLLIAADCAAYAYGSFHSDFMAGKVTLIGCPKLDDDDYTEKLTSILTHGGVRSVTVVRMEVPCCAGIAKAAMDAVKLSGRDVPLKTVIIRTDGTVARN